MEGQRVGSPPMRKPGTLMVELAAGQQVEGTVKRITDFGAFVDIGVGRDGMVHISELQLGSVEKVSDVVQVDQQVTAWVQNVDFDKKRINLTMVDPDRKKVRDLVPGATVEGTVTRMLPYGAFVDIGVEREAMLRVREMGDDYIKAPTDVVKPGDTISARVLAVDTRRRRIDLTMKSSEVDEIDEEAVIVEDDEEEAPTLMELRLKQAMEQQEQRKQKGRKKKQQSEQNQELDDIISRTLAGHKSDS